MQGNASDFRPIHLSSILHRTNQTDEAMRTILFTVLALLFVGDAHAQQTVVMGRLLTADGVPATQGHVFLVRNALAFPRGILHTVEPDASGRFEITLDAPKLHTLRFSAPVHRATEHAFYAEPGDTIEVDVRLGSLAFDPDQFTISYSRPSAPSLRLRDGYYGALDTTTVNPRWTRVEVPVTSDAPFSVTLPSPGDSLVYVMRASGWLSANDELTWTSNPGGGAVAVDRGGDYETLLATPRDSVSIAFDPADWPREATAHDVRWIRGSQRAKQFHDIDADVQRRRDAHRRQTKDQRNSGVIGALTETDWTSDVADLKRAVEQADDPFERGVRTMAYLRVVGSATYGKREGIALFVSRDEAEQMLQTLAPDSPLWSYRPQHRAVAVIRIASGPPRSRSAEGTTLLPMPDPLRSDRRMSARYRDYALALANHPDTTAAHHWLLSGVRYGADTDDYVTYSRFAARFFERFAGTAAGESEMRHIKYDDKTPPGSLLPDFAVPSLDDSDRMIRSEDLEATPSTSASGRRGAVPVYPSLSGSPRCTSDMVTMGFKSSPSRPTSTPSTPSPTATTISRCPGPTHSSERAKRRRTACLRNSAS